MNTALTIAVLVIPSVLVIASYLLARRKIEEIHKLVNHRLSIALEEVEELKKRLGVSHE